jgi:hypothetical protein
MIAVHVLCLASKNRPVVVDPLPIDGETLGQIEDAVEREKRANVTDRITASICGDISSPPETMVPGPGPERCLAAFRPLQTKLQRSVLRKMLRQDGSRPREAVSHAPKARVRKVRHFEMVQGLYFRCHDDLLTKTVRDRLGVQRCQYRAALSVFDRDPPKLDWGARYIRDLDLVDYV